MAAVAWPQGDSQEDQHESAGRQNRQQQLARGTMCEVVASPVRLQEGLPEGQHQVTGRQNFHQRGALGCLISMEQSSEDVPATTE